MSGKQQHDLGQHAAGDSGVLSVSSVLSVDCFNIIDISKKSCIRERDFQSAATKYLFSEVCFFPL